jgi:hypothetical protein
MPARAVLCAIVAASVLSIAGPQSWAQDGVDVVFLVDTSNFISGYDTDDSRLAVAHGVVDSMRDRGPQRIGVLSLSGEANAAPGSWVTLPLTALPEDPTAVSAFLDTRVHPALAGLGNDGACLPLNEAVQEHLAHMLEARRSADRPLWLVMLTHGEVDPLGPDGANAEDWLSEDVLLKYEETGRNRRFAKRPALRTAARALFLDRFPTQLAGLGDNVVLSIVDVNADPQKQGEVMQVDLGDQTVDFLARVTDSEVINLDGSNVRQVIDQLMAQAPFTGTHTAEGFITRVLASSPSQSLRIYQGTSFAQVTMMADHGDYTAELSYVEGTAGTNFYSTEGAGRLGRSLSFTNPVQGLVELTVTPDAGAAPLNLEAKLEFTLDLSIAGSTPADGAVHPVGSSIELAVRLIDNTGATLTDTHLLEGGTASASWTNSRKPGDSWSPGADETHTHGYSHDSVTDGQIAFPWTANASLLPDGNDGYAWTGSASGTLRAGFSTPNLTMTFDTSDDGVTFADNALSFGPEWVSGDVTTRATMLIEVDLHGSSEQVPVVLSFERSHAYSTASADGAVTASLTLDGSPIVNGSQVPFRDGTPLKLTIEVSKFGMPMPPFGDSIGTVVAELTTGGAVKRTQVDLSMTPTIGPITMMSLAGVAVLLLLLLLMIRKRMQGAAYRALIANLTDNQVIYFNDDEPGAPARGAAA